MTKEETREEIERLRHELNKVGLLSYIKERVLRVRMAIEVIEDKIHDIDKMDSERILLLYLRLDTEKSNLTEPKRRLDNFPKDADTIDPLHIEELQIYFVRVEERITALQSKLGNSKAKERIEEYITKWIKRYTEMYEKGTKNEMLKEDMEQLKQELDNIRKSAE